MMKTVWLGRTLAVLLAVALVGCSSASTPSAQPASTAPAAQASPAAASPKSTTAASSPAPSSSAAAAPAASASPAAAGKNLQKVNVTVPAAAEITYAILQMGADKGYFAQQGLDPVFQVAPAATGIKAVVANQYDLSIVVGSATQAIMRKAPLRIAYIYLQRPQWWIYGGKGVTSLKELAGKKLGVQAAGDASDTLSAQLLQDQGVDPKSVVRIPLGTPAARYAALTAGSVDAAVLIFPQNIQAEKQGLKKLAYFGDHYNIIMTGITTSEDTLKKKPQMLQAFMRASAKSIADFKSNKQDGVAAMVKNFKISEADASASYPDMVNLFAPNGIADDNTLRSSLVSFGAGLNGVDAKNYPLNQVFDFTLAKQAAGQ